MEVGFLSPIDCQRDQRAESHHVPKRNRQESICVFLLENHGVDTSHNHRDGDAKANHQRGEAGAKPAERAMHTHFAHPHQGGLSDEEHNPG